MQDKQVSSIDSSDGLLRSRLKKILPGAKGPIDFALVCTDILRSLGDGVAVYLVVLSVSHGRIALPALNP